jgi:methionine-gamma-lyase
MTSPSALTNAERGFATRAIHEGYDPFANKGAVTPPIYMTSTYAFESAEAGAELFRGERAGYIYGRNRNPTQELLETRMASLEGGEAAVAFASGVAAISATLMTLLCAGDEVILDKTVYGNTYALFSKGLVRFGIGVKFVDLTDPANLKAAITPKTKILFFETPANPNLRVIDIREVTAIARAAGIISIVDSTFSSPVIQRPISFGADIVVHSATKFLSGHGDLLAGIMIGRKEHADRVRGEGLRFLNGGTIAPLVAHLVMRGIKTLELRMERHSSSALAIAEMLDGHPTVSVVHYPGLPSFPQYELARRQMNAFGGLISLELKGGYAAGMQFMNKLKLATRAVSLGDAETLVQHPASMTHAVYPPEERLKHGISDGLVRLSVGLETLDDLMADIEQALVGLEV